MKMALAFALLFLCPSFSCAPSAQEKPGVIELAESLEKNVEELRGLRFRKPIKKGVKSAEDLRAFFQDKLYESMPAEKMRLYSRVSAHLGLLPEGYDMEKEILDFLSVGVGGVFDPKTKEFFLAAGMPGVMQKPVIVHEMTHALDDQYFDLDRFLDPSLSEDAGLGIAAVVEGSAMLVMNLYQVRTPGLVQEMLAERSETLRFANEQSEVLRRLPPYFARSFLCGYIAGPEFLAPPGLSDEQRQERVLQAFQDPPRSSEQVLHPEKYWDTDKRDEPITILLPDLTGILGDGWVKQGEDTLGELNVATLTMDPDDATDFADPMRLGQIEWTNEEAAGWGGDRWAAYAKDEEFAVFWLLVWDSERDAKEFSFAYRPPADAGLVLIEEKRVLVVATKRRTPAIEKAAENALRNAATKKISAPVK